MNARWLENDRLDYSVFYVEDVAVIGDLVMSINGYTNIVWDLENGYDIKSLSTYTYDVERWKIARMAKDEDVFLVVGSLEYDSYSMAFDENLRRKMLIVVYDVGGVCSTGYISGYRWNIVAKGLDHDQAR